MTATGSRLATPERKTEWLLLVYRIPSEPTRLRATAWRRLKSLGAIYLQNAVAALPASPASERALRTLRAEIGDMGGTATLLNAAPLAGGADITATFNAARDDEYDEIVDKCADFLTEIATETAAAHFTFAELEENDEDLTKLRGWHAKISARDVLGATGATGVRQALDQCATALEQFAANVYTADHDAGHGGDAGTGGN